MATALFTMVLLTESVLGQYQSFSLYNSPYPMHASGCAIDLYPAGTAARSPVEGRVSSTRTVTAPVSPTGSDFEHVIVIRTETHRVRILHVDPVVEPGEVVVRGDVLGDVIDSGYFAPWVDPHLHVGFRGPESDPFRARGSEPIRIEADIESVPWDGTGVVRDRTRSAVILDSPGHPHPGAGFAGIGDGRFVVDGGFPHYSHGGTFGNEPDVVSIAGYRIGRATERGVRWDDVSVYVNDTRVTGISFAVHRDRLGTKLVSENEIPVSIGDEVSVSIQPRDP